MFVSAGLDVDDVETHGDAHRHGAFEPVGHRLQGGPQLGEQRGVDHVGIAQRDGSRPDEITVEPLVVVEEAQRLQRATQAADRGARDPEPFRKLAVGMGAGIAHETLEDHQALGQRAGEVRVSRPHALQVFQIRNLMHSSCLLHGDILDRWPWSGHHSFNI